jgi:hypothetical protein
MKTWHNYEIMIGLLDRYEKIQKIKTEKAEDMIAEMLIGVYGIYAATISRCKGIYRMEDTGEIIQEISIKIEISSEDEIQNMAEICENMARVFNQESVMLKHYMAGVDFING